MPRFVAISDIHAHPFPYGASFVSYGSFEGLHNSRLVNTIQAMEGVADYAIANNIGTVLFVGDMYHTRQSIKTVARTLVTHVIKEKFLDRGIKFVAIPGNHDYADRSGHIHSLQALRYLSSNKGSIHILDTVNILKLDDLVIISVPYTDSIKKARDDLAFAASLSQQHKDQFTVLLCHLGVRGARIGSDYVLVCPSDVGDNDIPFDKFDLCLFGHYHQHQALAKNAWYVGALTQQNWSDVDGLRGFIDVGVSPKNVQLVGQRSVSEVPGKHTITRSGDKIPITHIETNAPKFLVCKDEVDLQLARDVDFVTYFTDKVLTEGQQKQLRAQCKSENFDIKPIKKNKQPELKLDAAQLNAESSLEPWVEENAVDGLEKESLLALGRELLAVGQGNEI